MKKFLFLCDWCAETFPHHDVPEKSEGVFGPIDLRFAYESLEKRPEVYVFSLLIECSEIEFACEVGYKESFMQGYCGDDLIYNVYEVDENTYIDYSTRFMAFLI